MYTKICRECQCNKIISEFYTAKGCNFGVAATCKSCVKLKNKNHYYGDGKLTKSSYYINNKNAIQAKKKIRYQKNKNKILTVNKTYRMNNKDKITAAHNKWVEGNKEKYKNYQLEYRTKNFKNLSQKSKTYRNKHKEKIKANYKNWKSKNIDRLRAWRREYDKKRRQNPMVRLYHNVSRRINESLKSNKAGRKWEGIVGYTLIKLKNHLENKFQNGMSWDNYGKNGWHIDHIMPRSIFNITSSECEEFKKCWDISNLQPLWEKDNLSKGNRP